MRWCRSSSVRRRSSPSRASRARPTRRRAAERARMSTDGSSTSQPPGVRRIYLVRHGETLYRGAALASGSRYDLTDRGVEQLRTLAELFRTIEVDRVVASPLARSFDTASIIAEAIARPVSVDEDLREIIAGSYEGKTGH